MPNLFFTPPEAPFYADKVVSGLFIKPELIPDYAEQGTYDPMMVVLSYVIVTVASYVGLDIAARAGGGHERSHNIKFLCGAFAMGAGIWSMHFIGMLAYDMNMLVTYDPLITALSMFVAVLFAAAAFTIIRDNRLRIPTVLIAAPLMGLAVCSMHYIGMEAMQMDAMVLYIPHLVVLSALIAVGASACALVLMFHTRNSQRPVLFKISAAMVMGLAVCGMHYVGMNAAVMLPFADCRYVADQDRSGMMAAVTLITCLIVAVAYLVRQLDDAIAQVQQRTAQLYQSQKMEAVGQLTGGIAHDFNNILAIVLGNLELLERQPNLSAAGQGYIQSASASVMKARALTQRLLAFSRKQVLQPEAVSLGLLMPAMLQFIERALGSHIVIRNVLKPNLPIIYVDPAQLEGALLNLSLNARDALPEEGGEIYVMSDQVSLSGARADDLNIPAGNYVTLQIVDKGCGMTVDVLNHATEPFFTTKDVGKGSGMGLSMVFGFARQSGGTLTLESEEGFGTTVTLYLPVPKDSTLQQSKAQAEKQDDIVNGRGSILVVDDQEEIRSYMNSALKELGYTPHIASSGEHAMAFVDSGADIDVIITDVVMPGSDGFVLAEKILKVKPDARVIFMSGYTPDLKVPTTLFPERTTFLTKPFTLGKLAQAIRLLLDEK